MEFKVVLVGDSTCGKTALVHRLLNDVFVEEYTPTGFQRYSSACEAAGKRIQTTLWDTSGSIQYDNIRPLSYQDARVFLLCFNIGQPETLDNIITKWFPEVRKHSISGVPVVLCGCQSDSRADSELVSALAKIRRLPVTFEQATAVGRQLEARCYVETSAKTSGKSVRDAFEVVALLAAGKQVQKNGNGSAGHSKIGFRKRRNNNARSWCNIM